MSEQHPFDRLSKFASQHRPRRAVMGAIAALLPGFVPGIASASPGKKKRDKKQKGKKNEHRRPAHLGEPDPDVDDCDSYLNEPSLQEDCRKIRRTCTAPDHLCIHVTENTADEDTRGVACCPDHKACCFTGCTDTRNDNENCGRCGRSCGADAVCVNEACVCPNGRTFCYGECVDTESNPDYCGGCDTLCHLGQVCRDGACKDPACNEPGGSCPPGQRCYDGVCGCGGFNYCRHRQLGWVCFSGDCSLIA